MINPLIFDCPPPIYEETQDTGWESIGNLGQIYLISQSYCDKPLFSYETNQAC